MKSILIKIKNLLVGFKSKLAKPEERVNGSINPKIVAQNATQRGKDWKIEKVLRDMEYRVKRNNIYIIGNTEDNREIIKKFIWRNMTNNFP